MHEAEQQSLLQAEQYDKAELSQVSRKGHSSSFPSLISGRKSPVPSLELAPALPSPSLSWLQLTQHKRKPVQKEQVFCWLSKRHSAKGEASVKASPGAAAGAPRQEEMQGGAQPPLYLRQPHSPLRCPSARILLRSAVQLYTWAALQFKSQEHPVCQTVLKTHVHKVTFQALTFPEYELSP